MLMTRKEWKAWQASKEAERRGLLLLECAKAPRLFGRGSTLLPAPKRARPSKDVPEREQGNRTKGQLSIFLGPYERPESEKQNG